MVGIDNVYKTVLYIINKEQRGYITPDEFNKLANQVQLDIYNSYFTDGEIQNKKDMMNVDPYSFYLDKSNNVEEKIEIFVKDEQPLTLTSGVWVAADTNIKTIGNIIATYDDNGYTKLQTVSWVDKVTKEEYRLIAKSRYAPADQRNPVYYASSSSIGADNGAKIYPEPDTVVADVLMLPGEPKWIYTEDPTTGAYVYSNTSIDFDLHPTEASNLITGILRYCGVIIKSPEVVQIAQQEMVNKNQENKI